MEKTLEQEFPDLSKSYGPGKFDTYKDAYLWALTLIGTDEETGDTDTTGWYGLLRGSFEHPDLVGVVGAIVTCDGNGFVRSTIYTTTEKLEADWAICLANTETESEES